jgi:hypothetical protein
MFESLLAVKCTSYNSVPVYQCKSAQPVPAVLECRRAVPVWKWDIGALKNVDLAVFPYMSQRFSKKNDLAVHIW